jgi:hypothetical protein
LFVYLKETSHSSVHCRRSSQSVRSLVMKSESILLANLGNHSSS